MDSLKKIVTWCFLTEKRLFKKISYVLMILVLPLLMAGMRTGVSDGSAVMTVAVGTDGAAGSFAARLVSDIAEDDALLKFIMPGGEEECLSAVSSGKADVAWIIHENIEEELEDIAKRGKLKPVADLIVREKDMAVGFVKEVFESRIFPEFIHKVYLDSVNSISGVDIDIGDIPEKAFSSQMMKALTFEPEYIDGTKAEDEGLLLTPLRGMLAIWLVMNGFAAMIYFKRDSEFGTYDMVPLRRRYKYMFGTEAVVLFNASLIYIFAVSVLGMVTNLLYELPVLALFTLCIAGFAGLVGSLARRASALGVVIPVLTVLMIVLCPIFVDIKGFEAVRAIMPPYMYLMALHDRIYTLLLAGYAAVLLAAAWLLGRTRSN